MPLSYYRCVPMSLQTCSDLWSGLREERLQQKAGRRRFPPRSQSSCPLPVKRAICCSQTLLFDCHSQVEALQSCQNSEASDHQLAMLDFGKMVQTKKLKNYSCAETSMKPKQTEQRFVVHVSHPESSSSSLRISLGT